MRIFFMTPLVIFLLMIIIMLAKLLDSGDKKPSPLLGKPLPAFNLPAAYDGDSTLLSTDLKGGYSLINIFASWCISCKIEHSFLLELKEKNLLPIYGIAWRDKPENLYKFLQDKGNPYTKIGNDYEGKTIIDLGVTGAPESFLISPDGIIVLAYAGPISQEIWDVEFAPIIYGGKK